MINCAWAQGQVQQTTTCRAQVDASCRHWLLGPFLEGSSVHYPTTPDFGRPRCHHTTNHSVNPPDPVFSLSLSKPVLTKPLLQPGFGAVSKSSVVLSLQHLCRTGWGIIPCHRSRREPRPARREDPQKNKHMQSVFSLQYELHGLSNHSDLFSGPPVGTFLPPSNPSGIRKGRNSQDGQQLSTGHTQTSAIPAGRG